MPSALSPFGHLLQVGRHGSKLIKSFFERQSESRKMFDFANLDDIEDNGAPPEWKKWQGIRWQREPEEELPVLVEEREETFAAPEVVQAYIEKLHEQRLAYLAAKRSDILAKRGLEMREKGSAPTLDRKPFAWRELRSVLSSDAKQMPKDGWMCESVLNASRKLTRSLVPVGSGAMLPPSVLLHILVSFGSQVRPDPPGRWGRNAARHLSISDCFFPTGMILTDASDIIEQKKEAPTLVHMVAMSVNKENGDLEAKHLLDNIQLPTPASYPSIKPRHQIRR
ncbi:hypothetical protein AK812_SmicGene7709 [Symbiodinium microadriaticum]|uniref:Uncharacterized protein n=1 Tax=Symbiodinium microadriaticum TaxID=2951 RepID=A0A1Q9EMR2_SYMMI|nr:hypothetical protein AK812_SmicGene7709 [Symbiodinium microadriaticum]